MTGTVAPHSRGNYATVNGLRIYYELHGPTAGTSPPVILLHGGVGGIEMFGPNLSALARSRRVIAVDLESHGLTADLDRPLRCEQMADDIAALVEHLGIQKVDLMGYSLGGGVALQTTIRRPEIVRRLVVVSAPFRRSAFYPEVLAAFDHMGPAAGAMMKQSPLARLYPDVDWSRLFGKIGELQRRDYDWSAEIAKIKSPVMLVFADADAIPPSRIAEFYALLGGGQRDAGLNGADRPAARLAIVPGATHYDILSTTIVAELVDPFLDAGPASTSAPETAR
jgi:pimeloyl-ACP methyl ester carboxylesterase